MKNIKKIIGSLLLATAFAATSVGTTFALFTDEAKTTINVQSGKVEVRQTLAIQNVYELGNVSVSAVEGVYTNSIGGKTYIDSDNANLLHLEKWAPGDKAVIKVTNNNYSNVTIKTRFTVDHTSTSTPDLFTALQLNYLATDANNVNIGYKFMDWSPVEPTVSKISDVLVTIEFPDGDDGEILFGDANHDNTYKDCNCTIIFTQQAVQGNAHTDSILDRLNGALDSAAATDGRNKTMYDALQDVSSIMNEPLIKTAGYVWNSSNDHFYYGQEGTTNEYFRIYDTMPDTQTNSIYASSLWNTATVDLTGVGFDAGSASGIITVNYVGASQARSNVIRTNTVLTNVNIDAPADVIHHYDNAGLVSVTSVATSSYHEHGVVPFLEVAGGHVVLEGTSDVSAVHFSATGVGQEAKFENEDGVKISLDLSEATNMPSFSRDPVTIEENGTFVAQVTTEKTEQIWLFGIGIKEQMVVTEEIGDIAENGTLKDGITPGAEDDSVAEQIANPAKRNSDGELLNENDEVIDLSDVSLDTHDALENESVIVEEVKTKEEAKEDYYEAYSDEMSEVVDEDDQQVYAAIIKTTPYITFEAACLAANTNSAFDKPVIRLLADANITFNLTFSKATTIDLNGYTLTSYTNKSLTYGNNFTMRNGTFAPKKAMGLTAGITVNYENMNYIKDFNGQGFQLYSKHNTTVNFKNVNLTYQGTPSNNRHNSALIAFSGSDNNDRFNFEKTNISWTSNVPFVIFGSNTLTSYVQFDSQSYASLSNLDNIGYTSVSNPVYLIKQTMENNVYKVRPIVAEYWLDKVESQPETYIVEGNNISLGSEEAFAWFAKEGETNNFAGKTVSLTADIDMEQYLWKPIKTLFAGTFNGNNHIISRVYSRGGYDGYGNGIFHAISGSVSNLIIDRSTIGCSDVTCNISGGLTGYDYGGTYTNVTVRNTLVEGFGKVAGIIGMQEGTTTLNNCSVINTVIEGAYNCAGLIGLAHNTVIINNQTLTNITHKRPYQSDAVYTEITEGPLAGLYWANEDYGLTNRYAAWANLYCDYEEVENGEYTYVGYCHN